MKRQYESAPNYVIVDVVKRDAFEKKWHMSAGYLYCPVTTNIASAIQKLHEMSEQGVDTKNLIVEKVSVDGRETVYRI